MTDSKGEQTRTAEGKLERQHMEQAAWISEGLWNATNWLLTFLGASALFTAATQFGPSGDRVLLGILAAATGTVVVGVAARAMVTVVTLSRKRRADEAAKRRGAAYLLINFLLLVQLVAMPSSALLQGLAVYHVLQSPNVEQQLNGNLASRLDGYGSFNGEAIVGRALLEQANAYCTEHLTDASATAAFREVCASLAGTPVSPVTAKNLASLLRRP